MAFRKFFKLPKKEIPEEKNEPIGGITIVLIGNKERRETLLRLMMLIKTTLESCVWHSVGDHKELAARIVSINNLEKCHQMTDTFLNHDNVFLYCPTNAGECAEWLGKFQDQLQRNINHFVISNDADVRRVAEARDLIVFPYPRNTKEATGVLSEVKQMYLAFRELIPSNRKKLVDAVKAPRFG